MNIMCGNYYEECSITVKMYQSIPLTSPSVGLFPLWNAGERVLTMLYSLSAGCSDPG